MGVGVHVPCKSPIRHMTTLQKGRRKVAAAQIGSILDGSGLAPQSPLLPASLLVAVLAAVASARFDTSIHSPNV